MDEAFNRQYRSDLNFGKLVNIFTGLAIFIASIGLFGLTTYIAEQRTREIGIRKVLGASVASLVSLLSKDFLKLILLAVVISMPAAQYVMNKWLSGFAYRITPGLMTYLIPGFAVIAVALMVIATQAIRTSMTDPVKSLRND
jgi:putative ABC transport system permease protein